MMRRVRAFILVLIVAIELFPGSSRMSPAYATALVEKRRELQELLSQLTLHRQQLRQVRQRERRILQELEGIDRTREEADRRLTQLAIELRRSRVNAQATATKLAVSQRRLTVRRALLRERLRDTYKYGQTGYVEVLLGATDFAEFVTRWQFVSTIARADDEAITAFNEEATRYHQLHTNLLQEQTHLRVVASDTEVRRQEIIAQERAKRATLQRIQAERTAYERVVRELEQNSRDLEILIRHLQTGPGGPPGAVGRGLGAFIWPARGTFTSGFGWRRHPIFGIRSMHTGTDIAAAWGSHVAAAAHGRVIYTGWFGGYGKIVVIDHGGGVSTLYAHLSQILVTAEAIVRRGQIIGRVGSTGYSTGPHVHFEIRINGTPIDPERR